MPSVENRKWSTNMTVLGWDLVGIKTEVTVAEVNKSAKLQMILKPASKLVSDIMEASALVSTLVADVMFILTKEKTRRKL